MSKSLKILFITHDASRTGAPILLLKLITWLQKDKNIQPVLLAINGGPLYDEFNKCGDCYLWNDSSIRPTILKRIYFKIINSTQAKQRQVKINNELGRKKFDIVYINSIASLSVLDDLSIKFPERGTILHVHELQTIIRQGELENNISDPMIDKYIAVSNLVKDNLISNYTIDPKKVFKVNEYIDTGDWDMPVKRKTIKGPIIIAGIGYVHWRKGVDLFILIANEIKKRGMIEDFEFWWIGGISDDDHIYMYDDLVKLGLEDKVRFLEEQKDLREIYPEIDILAITSREDPYPTVALEAAFHSIPFVCWNQGIGTAELVEKKCGMSVDYFDIGAMAETLITLKDNDALCIELGQNAKAEAEKHDIEIAGQMIFEIIKGD